MRSMVEKIKKAVDKFILDLNNKTVLTEAASGNYVVTPVLAALAGANVLAITRDSNYASKEKVFQETYQLAEKLGVEQKIQIFFDKNDIMYGNIDIVTNTGFVRPIDKQMIDKLSAKCVIPLMWEPWEFRSDELDLEYCVAKGIKVYGTNEQDSRLQTMKYIGFTVLYFLLDNKMSSFSAIVLIIGNKSFAKAINSVLVKNDYSCDIITDYNDVVNLEKYQAIVIAEHIKDKLIIGSDKDAFIKTSNLRKNQYVIHICGNIDIRNIPCKTNTSNPSKHGYMSFTADFIDSQAVIDLHAAGLKVAEGMMRANGLSLKHKDYKEYLEKNYPTKAFENEKYW